MRPGTYGSALTWLGLLAGGLGLCFVGSRLLHIPGPWPAAIPIALYALLVIAYGWRAGSLHFHAVRGALLGAIGLGVLILLDRMSPDASRESIWSWALFMVSFPTVQHLQTRDAIERPAKAHRTQPWQYAVVALGVVLFVVEAIRQ